MKEGMYGSAPVLADFSLRLLVVSSKQKEATHNLKK
jgi:hypothetical protein